MSSSDLSELSSSLSSEEDVEAILAPKSKNLDYYFKNAHVPKPSPPPKKKRPPSPPHEYVLADNPDIALTLLSALIMWSLGASDNIQDIIKDKFKQQRKDGDVNQPLSVQPWGNDSDKRRYWLVEGLEDTTFRLYRESNPALKHVTWRSVAGSIDDLKQIATQLDEDGGQHARKLRDGIEAAIPRFEAGEDKRKRREYRMARKAQFTRPDPGFSLYEGRTRGKRMKYTFSDEEDGGSDAISTRHSNRQSGVSTPVEALRPTVTASGRQVKSRYASRNSEPVQNGQRHQGEVQESDGMDPAQDNEHNEGLTAGTGRMTRTRGGTAKHAKTYGSTDDTDTGSDVTSSGHEWDGGDDDADDQLDDDLDEEEEMNDEFSEDELAINNIPHKPRSLVVALRYLRPSSSHVSNTPTDPSNMAESGGLSNQAPPPEANPFATPVDTDTSTLNIPNGIPSPAKEAIDPVFQPGALTEPPMQPHQPPQPILPIVTEASHEATTRGQQGLEARNS
ncbi:MAG: hypothetical protein Q9222_004792 [Ikaeria aurantiellina]